MDDIIKSIKATLYDRAVSPLFGAFVFAWLVWNYPFVLVFFSDMPVDEKINYIQTFIFSNWCEYLVDGIAVPLTTTLFYIFAFPYPARFVYSYSLKRQSDLNGIKQTIEDMKLLSVKDSMTLKAEIYQLEDMLSDQLNRKDEAIQVLKSQIKSLNLAKNTKNSTLDTQKTENQASENVSLSDEEIQVLKIIGENNNEEPDGYIQAKKLKSNLNPINLQYTLNNLKRHDFIYFKSEVVKIKEKGTAYLVENGLVD